MVLLAARSIRKTYGATFALDGVDFSVHAGAVNVIIGENGAGKSTLMKILAGVEQPSAGELILDGQAISLPGVRAAERHGISIVHQELSLCPNLTVAENIFLGRETGGLIDQAHERTEAERLIAQFGQVIAADTLVGDLQIGQQQIVEIARALAENARILILDEPTSALSPAEIAVLFTIVGGLKAQGIAVVYISHKLEELLKIGDFFTVLRDGRLQATAPAAEVSLDWITGHMLGKTAGARRWNMRPARPETVLSVRGLSLPRASGGQILDRLSFDVFGGQIVAIYGLLGCGRTEFFETVMGLRPFTQGRVELCGEDISNQPSWKQARKRVFLVPEDRQREGLFHNLTVGGNLGLSQLTRFVVGGLISPTRENAALSQMIAQLGVKTAGIDAGIQSLSGGNQQKVVIGRSILAEPKLLLIDEPGRGVDIGAREDIFDLIRAQADAGTTVIFSTSDLQEALTVADRILVFSGGQLAADLPADQATEARLVAACNTTYA